MIRINLHPVRQIKKVQAGKRQLLIFALIIVAEVALMGLLYTWRDGEIQKKQERGESRPLTGSKRSRRRWVTSTSSRLSGTA